jgi:hypothetical protein
MASLQLMLLFLSLTQMSEMDVLYVIQEKQCFTV